MDKNTEKLKISVFKAEIETIKARADENMERLMEQIDRLEDEVRALEEAHSFWYDTSDHLSQIITSASDSIEEIENHTEDED